ncbi:MAG: alpha/beta fold hydrolase [Actinomycetota bacterium]
MAETPDETPDWIHRFTAPSIGFPDWDDASPEQMALVGNQSGAWQAWAHDRTDGSWRQASAEPVGVESVWMLPDGRIAWWQDTTGDERGALVAVGFAGGRPDRVFPDVPDGWLMGLSFEAGRTAIGVEVEGSYRIFVVDPDAMTRPLATLRAASGVGNLETGGGGLSADGSLVCIYHGEHGDILHSAMRVLDTETGAVVGDLEDEGHHLVPAAWSPVPGDRRLAFTSERAAFERPAIWDLASGERRDLAVALPGAVFPLQWWPDASALLVRHEFEGRGQLLRLDIATGETTPLTDLLGDIERARLRPDGTVWFRVSDAVHPARIVDGDGEIVIAITTPDGSAPAGTAYESRFAYNPQGDRIHMFAVTPQGDGPFPTVLNIHGGPEWHERDRFDPETQAFVDAGYAVALVNYRGSTGYGVAFREALIGRVCLTESEDILACLDALIADGTTDPTHVYWSGWSWGGCLACFHAGAHPDRFRAIFAGIPAGDFVAAHWASAPELQAWDDAVYGGSPDEAPDAYKQSDPMTYVDAVTAPMLIIAGEHDPRCPIEGVTPWVDAVQAHGGTVEVHTYDAGHHTNTMSDRVTHMRWVLDFFDRHR